MKWKGLEKSEAYNMMKLKTLIILNIKPQVAPTIKARYEDLWELGIPIF
jgi:hypothetical protein